MDSEADKKKDLGSNEESGDFAEFGPIKRPPFTSEVESESITTHTYQLHPQVKSANKKTIILVIILMTVLIVSGYMLIKSRRSFNKVASKPTEVANIVPTPTPTETPKPALTKSEWTFEVLNGSGEVGLAKKIADKIKELGYEVTKTGNADKSDYEKTQIFVTKDLTDKVKLVIVDLQDVIKIASFGGELKDSTPSARIIIGKDSI